MFSYGLIYFSNHQMRLFICFFHYITLRSKKIAVTRKDKNKELPKTVSGKLLYVFLAIFMFSFLYLWNENYSKPCINCAKADTTLINSFDVDYRVIAIKIHSKIVAKWNHYCYRDILLLIKKFIISWWYLKILISNSPKYLLVRHDHSLCFISVQWFWQHRFHMCIWQSSCFCL